MLLMASRTIVGSILPRVSVCDYSPRPDKVPHVKRIGTEFAAVLKYDG